jgi:hypothetical protein
VDSTQARAIRPVARDESYGSFSLSIRREAPDSLQGLLSIAESLYPPRTTLLDLAVLKGYEMGPDTAGVPLWWCEGVGADRIPYAVTAGALAYYVRLTELFGTRRFRDGDPRSLFSSRFTYRASAGLRASYESRGLSFTNVFLARLTLNWTYDDGTFVSLVDASRVVVLTREGAVLAVEGDGGADEQSRISGHRGIGRVETPPR